MPLRASAGDTLAAMSASVPLGGKPRILLQAGSSSSARDYDAHDDGDLVDDLVALDGLPIPFDDALIPEALSILGFDMSANGFANGFDEMETNGIQADFGDDHDDEDDEGTKKAAKVPGGNQRAVQKRYRERKKNYTKDLEKKVEVLETQLKQLQSEQHTKHEDDVLAHMALGRVVPDGRLEVGGCSGGGGGDDDDDAFSSIDANSGLEKKKVNLKKCPLEHQRFIDSYHGKIQNMRLMLDRGASDVELRNAIVEVTSLCAPKSAMGIGTCVSNFSFSYQMIMNKHAKALNAEAQAFGHETSGTYGHETESHSDAIDGLKSEPDSPDSSDAKANGAEKQTRTETNAGKETSCPGDICGSICGGPLRTVALDGTIMTEAEQDAQIKKACDAFLLVTPPIEVEKLITWRDAYMDELREVYFGRQKLGIALAQLGGAMVSHSRSPGAVAGAVAGAGGVSSDGKTSSEDSGSGSLDSAQTDKVVSATITLARGGTPVSPVVKDEPQTSAQQIANGGKQPTSFVRGGGNVMDVLTVVEKLKASVKVRIARFPNSNTVCRTRLTLSFIYLSTRWR